MSMEALRCKSHKMLHKELEMFFIAYNLIRCLMAEASAIYEVPMERLSFKGTRGFGAAIQRRYCAGALPKERAGISRRIAEGDRVRSTAGAARAPRTSRGQTPPQALSAAQQTPSPVQGNCASQSLLEKQPQKNKELN